MEKLINMKNRNTIKFLTTPKGVRVYGKVNHDLGRYITLFTTFSHMGTIVYDKFDKQYIYYDKLVFTSAYKMETINSINNKINELKHKHRELIV